MVSLPFVQISSFLSWVSPHYPLPVQPSLEPAGHSLDPGVAPCYSVTHHDAHHPAHIDWATAARAVAAGVLQELGVHIQEGQTDIQDLIFKLSNKRMVRGQRSCLFQEACLEASHSCKYLLALCHTSTCEAAAGPAASM